MNKLEVPSIEVAMRLYKLFNKHGLFKDDLCFEPEHFISTVILPKFNDYD